MAELIPSFFNKADFWARLLPGYVTLLLAIFLFYPNLLATTSDSGLPVNIFSIVLFIVAGPAVGFILWQIYFHMHKVVSEDVAGTFQIALRQTKNLPKGESESITVVCVPGRSGKTAGSLAVDMNTNTTNGVLYTQRFEIPLTVVATTPRIMLRNEIPPIQPVKPIDPMLVVDFGTVAPSSQLSNAFFIGNIGDADLTVSEIVLRVGNAFWSEPVVMPLNIQPNEWIKISVYGGSGTARPGEIISNEWAVMSDDPFTPERKVILTPQISGPRPTLSSEDIDFGTVLTGVPSARTISLGNVGTEPLIVKGIKWQQQTPFTFMLPAGITIPFTIAPGAVVNIEIMLDQSVSQGIFVDYLTVYSKNTQAVVSTAVKVRIHP